jgi:alkaline phosphatase
MVGVVAAVGALIGVPLALGGERPSADDWVRSQLRDGGARNVIFFLGDGMGAQEITAARYYQYGAAGRRGASRYSQANSAIGKTSRSG